MSDHDSYSDRVDFNPVRSISFLSYHFELMGETTVTRNSNAGALFLDLPLPQVPAIVRRAIPVGLIQDSLSSAGLL